MYLLLLLPAPPVTAAEQPADPTAQASVDGRTAEAEKPNTRSKRDVATVAVYLLAGIVFAGLAMLALTVLWGRRIRRAAHKPLPRRSQTDEFWYLRPNKEIKNNEASEPPGSDADDEET